MLLVEMSLYSFICFLAMFIMLPGIVAEKSRVRLSGLVPFRMFSTSSINPILSISSASSRTAYFTAAREMLFLFIWSIIRPGVPTTISTPF